MSTMAQAVAAGKENLAPRCGCVREKSSPLPVWHPRRPLQDITTAMEAMKLDGGAAAGPGRVKKRKEKKLSDGRSLPAAKMSNSSAVLRKSFR